MSILTTESLRMIRTHLNHINGYSDMLRFDMRLAGKQDLADAFRLVSAETAEINYILIQDQCSKSDADIQEVTREEIARHLYIILIQLVKIGNKEVPKDVDYFDSFLQEIRVSAFELTHLFEKLLDISPGSTFELSKEEVERIPDFFQEQKVPRETEEKEGSILLLGLKPEIRTKIINLVTKQGYDITPIYEDTDVLEYANYYKIGVIILDITANSGQGLEWLKKIKHNLVHFTTPVIVVSDCTNSNMILSAIQTGAEDFMPTDFNINLFLARIKACYERQELFASQHLYIKKLEATKNRVLKELADGSTYVENLLPKPFSTPLLSVDWVFIPSLALGGDIFGYHWLNETKIAFYLIDVSGHGVEASLLSVTIMNVLKNMVLPKTDFENPASVLHALNQTFLIEEQNNMYFTAWYGVFNTETRILNYASAGSQPAIFFPPDSPCENLSTHGLIIGLDQKTEYENGTRFMSPKARLYIFSDGIFEIRKKNKQMMNLQEFTEILSIYDPKTEDPRKFATRIANLSLEKKFEDDVSFIEVQFN